MNERDKARLQDMLEAAEKARRFIAGKTRADLDIDEMLAFAVTRAIEIVGEAASHVSEETQATHPTVEWHGIIGMRHRIVHDYLNVDYNIVWDVLTYDLPALIAELTQILQSER